MRKSNIVRIRLKKKRIRKRAKLDRVHSYKNYWKKKKRKNKCCSSNGVGVIRKNWIEFPEHLSITADAETLVHVLKDAEKQELPTLSFRKSNFVTISAGVYLRAFCDHLKIEGNGYKISCPPKNRKMREVLQFLDIHNFGVKIKRDDLVCWEIRSWDLHQSAPNFAKLLMEDILPDVLKGKFPSEDFNEIASTLQEVLWNCVEHAYDKNAEYKFKRYYLIAGEYLNSDYFAFSVVDRGQGFLESLKQQDLSFYQKYMSSESKMIKAAVNGQSGAGKQDEGRGTGLQSVLDRVKKMKGEFFIYSGKGFYHFKKDSEIIEDHDEFIKGALFTMILPISENKEGREDET